MLFGRIGGCAAHLGILVALAIAAYPAAGAAQHPPVVEGRVVDRVSGSPVAGARIGSDGSAREATAAVGGGFTIRGLPPGTRALRIEAVGYLATTVQVLVRNGEVATVRVELDPDPLGVQGIDVSGGRALPSDAIVLDRGTLQARGPADLAVALQDVPGLVVTRRGGPGAPATVSIRGGSPDQVLVLLDGVPVNAPLTGGIDLSTISLDAVERVTVLPGVQSARYGPRALSGVILIEGRRAGAERARGSASAGSWGSRQVALGAGGVAKTSGGAELSGRLGGELRDTQGDFSYVVPDVRGGGTATRVNADAFTLSLTGSGALASGSTDVRVLADYVDLERGMPGPVAAPTPTARQEQRRITAGGAATIHARVGWDVALDAQRQEARFSDPSPPSGGSFDDATIGRGFGTRISAGALVGRFEVDGGVEGRVLHVESTALAADAPDRQRSLGVWAAATTRMSPGEHWTATVTGAVRADRHSFVSATEVSPRLGGALARGRWTLRASVGSGFSAPSLADQFFQEGVLTRPNPELGPERVRGEVEVGAAVRLLATRSVSLGATLDLYRANVDGMILWFPDHRFVWSPSNFDVDRRGWEGGLDLSLPPASTRLRFGVARARVEYAAPVLDGQVVYRPEWTGNGSLTSAGSVWSAEVTGRYVGTRRTVPGSEVNSLDPYWIADLRIGARWPIGRWAAETRLTLQNVFAAAAAMIPDYPLPGRAWGLQLSVNPR